MFEHDHEHGHDDHNPPQRINLVVSADPALMQLLVSIQVALQGSANAHLIALKAKAISAHLTTVTTQLKELTKPTSEEKM